MCCRAFKRSIRTSLYIISDEYDRVARDRALKSAPPKFRVRDRDEALAVTQGVRRTRGPCWICGEAVHIKRESPREKSKSQNFKESANIVDGSDEDSDGVWCVTIDQPDVPDCSLDAPRRTPKADRLVLLDSGTTRHISPFKEDFSDFRAITPKHLVTANRQKFAAAGEGSMEIELSGGQGSLKLSGVLFSPDVGYTLISIGVLTKEGYSFSFTFSFTKDTCDITSPDGVRVGSVARSERNLYRVRCEGELTMVADVEVVGLMDMHARLGHIAPPTVKQMFRDKMFPGLTLDPTSKEHLCASCAYGKLTRAPILKTREGPRSSRFGDIIPSDVWGPSHVATGKGKRYYVSFTDDATRITRLYFLRQKSEVLSAFKQFKAWCATQQASPIRTLHSDRGGE
jgi:hypothetical protein